MKIIEIVSGCCEPLAEAPLDEGAAEALAGAFKVLADPARLRLYSLISSRPGGEACVCELVEPLGLSQPTVSHHLKILFDSGLVERERRGTWVYYRAVPESLEVLRGALGAGAGGAAASS